MPTNLADTTAFQSAIKDSSLSVVHFSADFVPQCGQVNDVLDTLATHADYAAVKFYRCEAEELSEVSLSQKIEAVPTVILFRSGKVVDRVDGADPAKITERIKAHNNDISLLANIENNRGESLEDRLKALINKANVVLFMKGDRNTPKCGFSRQIIEILNGTGVAYETFDILTDEEVRQGLKSYSDWPTYPQLYVKGELIGGLDIVKEMLGAGELESSLKA